MGSIDNGQGRELDGKIEIKHESVEVRSGLTVQITESSSRLL